MLLNVVIYFILALFYNLHLFSPSPKCFKFLCIVYKSLCCHRDRQAARSGNMTVLTAAITCNNFKYNISVDVTNIWSINFCNATVWSLSCSYDLAKLQLAGCRHKYTCCNMYQRDKGILVTLWHSAHEKKRAINLLTPCIDNWKDEKCTKYSAPYVRVPERSSFVYIVETADSLFSFTIYVTSYNYF